MPRGGSATAPVLHHQRRRPPHARDAASCSPRPRRPPSSAQPPRLAPQGRHAADRHRRPRCPRKRAIADAALAGTLAAARGSVALHPIDTIKTGSRRGNLSLGPACSKTWQLPRPGPSTTATDALCIRRRPSLGSQVRTLGERLRWTASKSCRRTTSRWRAAGPRRRRVFVLQRLPVPGELLKIRIQNSAAIRTSSPPRPPVRSATKALPAASRATARRCSETCHGYTMGELLCARTARRGLSEIARARRRVGRRAPGARAAGRCGRHVPRTIADVVKTRIFDGRRRRARGGLPVPRRPRRTPSRAHRRRRARLLAWRPSRSSTSAPLRRSARWSRSRAARVSAAPAAPGAGAPRDRVSFRARIAGERAAPGAHNALSGESRAGAGGPRIVSRRAATPKVVPASSP